MESSIWEKFKIFIRESLTQKFKAFFPGCIMGFIGSRSLLFSGLPAEMVTVGAYVLKYIGTIIMAFSSGLATSYAAFLIEKYKNKKHHVQQSQKRKKGGGSAA